MIAKIEAVQRGNFQTNADADGLWRRPHTLYIEAMKAIKDGEQNKLSGILHQDRLATIQLDNLSTFALSQNRTDFAFMVRGFIDQPLKPKEASMMAQISTYNSLGKNHANRLRSILEKA